MKEYIERESDGLSAPMIHGQWLEDEKKSSNRVEPIYFCSVCRKWEAWGETEKTNYCPYCGAKMDLKEREE